VRSYSVVLTIANVFSIYNFKNVRAFSFEAGAVTIVLLLLVALDESITPTSELFPFVPAAYER
jgi:hypothetical protein